MAHVIDRGWWSECSACGGNADPNEAAHIHGGPDKGGSYGPSNMRSALSEKNGCGAVFGNRTLWDRKRVDELKRTAWVIESQGIVMFEKYASPADSLKAAEEMGFPHFSHMKNGYPVYSKEERSI